MAAPAEVTIQNLNGRWVMQGISWLVRKTIGLATVTLHVKQYTDDAGNVHIDIAQTLTGGIPGTNEERILTWEKRDHTDHVFGNVVGQSRYVRGTTGADGKVRPEVDVQTKTGDEKEQEAVTKFLKGEILADRSATEGFVVGEGEDFWVQNWVESVNDGWTAEQIWGFENVDGARRYTRRVVARNNGKIVMARLVYDFVGPAE
ncbi:hypothetical protein PRK78_003138 [Emydomyces testavorans]|uniref:LCCL domain-containing protein n=1 Tax=Emydomyces testavorans TaxID=2070801 RepID=A0AAF0IIH3_9EURO|nr:hypothetical protein PRK78_003138 [Emydomyces testavorans]